MEIKLIGENVPNIHTVLENRGFRTVKELESLDSSCMIDPFKMKNMRNAVEAVHRHITETDLDIAIMQDPDADGVASATLIYNYLTYCYPKEEKRLFIVIQEDKHHGINVKDIYRWNSEVRKVGLIIAPDCSSNEIDVHKKITEETDMEIVVLDHHDMEDYSPYAVVVNPSKDDYPNKSVSGVLVCMKFAQAFDKTYNFNFSDFFYDLVAVGVVADMIEINTKETIYMVQKGLDFKNLALKAIQDKKSYALSAGLNPVAISFYISPVINALTRVGTPYEKALLASSLILNRKVSVPSQKRGAKDGDVEEYHEQVARILNNVQSRQKRVRAKAEKYVENQIPEQEDQPLLILNTDGEFPPTFNGLIANEFRSRHGKPVFVGKVEDGKFKGSARGDDSYKTLPKLKTENQNTGLFDFAEGHESAHGVQFPIENKEKIVKHFSDKYSVEDFTPVHKVDFDLPYSSVSVNTLEEITSLFPFWAIGFEEPKFVLRGVNVESKDVVVTGDFDTSTLKFKTKNNVNFIGFKVPREVAVVLATNHSSEVDIVGSARLNSWKGNTSMQINIHDIEIKKKQKYNF